MVEVRRVMRASFGKDKGGAEGGRRGALWFL